MRVTITFAMVLSLPAISHAHPNHAGEVGHDHSGLLAGALLMAMSVLVLSVAAARQRWRLVQQHRVIERGLYRCP